MTSLAAALSEPAASALELYCVPRAWLAKPRPISRTSQAPMTVFGAARRRPRCAEQG